MTPQNDPYVGHFGPKIHVTRAREVPATEQNDPYVGHFVPPYAYFTIAREEIVCKMTPMWVILHLKYMLTGLEIGMK